MNALKQLENEVFKEDAWPVLDILFILLIPGGINLKATADNTIIGFISVEENLFDPTSNVNTVGVSPNFRRQGVGEALMRTIESRVRRPTIQLCVRISNQEAIDLYQKLGYRKKETRSHYYADGEDAFLMVKKLQIKSESLLK